jgi:hypothetical protein
MFPGEGRDPDFARSRWAPAFAGDRGYQAQVTGSSFAA